MIPIFIPYLAAVIFYLSSILIHLLVLKKKIDYTLVNGGRSNNFNEQQKQSTTSIMILIIFLLYILSTVIFPASRDTTLYVVIIGIMTLFWLMGTVLQLLGTVFEKKVVVWVNIIGLVSHVLLFIEYFG